MWPIKAHAAEPFHYPLSLILFDNIFSPKPKKSCACIWQKKNKGGSGKKYF